MPLRSKYALIGVLVALLAGGFLWKYGDSTGPVDATEPELVGGWHRADLALPASSDALPGIDGARAGIPRTGTFLVNLWASYCGPCRHEMPWLEQLDSSGQVDVLGVTRDNLLSEARKAIAKRKVHYPNLRDEYGDFMQDIADAVPPKYLPSTLLVVDGTITWTHLGPFESYADLRDSVSERL